MIEDYEIRTKAAEISVAAFARITAAAIEKHGVDFLTEIEPLGFASAIETYIYTGELPKPIVVKKTI